MIISGDKVFLAGLDPSDVVSATIFVTDYAATLPLLNGVYAQCFPDAAGMHLRTCVGVAALPLGAAAEFSSIAATRLAA